MVYINYIIYSYFLQSEHFPVFLSHPILLTVPFTLQSHSEINDYSLIEYKQ